MAVKQVVLINGLVNKFVLHLGDDSQNLVDKEIEQARCINRSNDLPAAQHFDNCTKRLHKITSRIFSVVKFK